MTDENTGRTVPVWLTPDQWRHVLDVLADAAPDWCEDCPSIIPAIERAATPDELQPDPDGWRRARGAAPNTGEPAEVTIRRMRGGCDEVTE